MGIQEQIAALRAKAAKGDKSAIAELKKLGIALKAEDGTEDDPPPEETEGEGGTEDEPKPDETEGEGEDGDGMDGDEEDPDKEPAANATGSSAGFALVGSSAGKGREKLAAQLGRKVAEGKLTYGEAKGMLAASPRGSRLAATMADRDSNIGGDTGKNGKPGAGLAAAVDKRIASLPGARKAS